MTTQVRRLEALDHVSRAPDPGDGRAVLVRATPAGAARHQRPEEAARPVYGALLDGWSDDDLRNAAHVARLLVRTLEHPGRPSQ